MGKPMHSRLRVEEGALIWHEAEARTIPEWSCGHIAWRVSAAHLPTQQLGPAGAREDLGAPWADGQAPAMHAEHRTVWCPQSSEVPYKLLAAQAAFAGVT